MMAVMVPLYATSLGLGAEWLGLLVAMPGMFPVLLAIPASRLVARLGPARWLFVGMLGMASATDPDLPGQSLTFTLDAPVPPGATIGSSSGVFTP